MLMAGLCWQQTSIFGTEEMALVLCSVAAAMQAEGYSERDCFGVRLALEEALANAVKHGHKGNGDTEIEVRYRVTATETLVEVKDQGEGFDPGQVPDPLAEENLEKTSGRGLLLMRHYLTWLRYSARGNAVMLCKQCSQA